ncbi:MAG: hypothetical protein WBA73_04360 [Devosia sp.]
MLDWIGTREAGYGYAVIGDPGPVEFYRKRLDAMEIPAIKSGVYAGMLQGRALCGGVEAGPVTK